MATKKGSSGSKQEDRITIDRGGGGIIEGGEIKELDAYKIDPLKKEKAATTRALAYFLVTILALSVAFHYGMVIWLFSNGKQDAIVELDSIYNTWLPVISGLAGSAVTYYFTQDK